MRKQGVTIDRNIYSPVTLTPIFDTNILEYWSTTFGYGVNVKYRLGKYQLRVDVASNLDWIARTTPGWKQLHPWGAPILAELAFSGLGLAEYWDYFSGPTAGFNATSIGISIERAIYKGLNLNIGFQFQPTSKENWLYNYYAQVSNDDYPVGDRLYNDTFFRRKIEVLKLGLSYDFNWGTFEKKEQRVADRKAGKKGKKKMRKRKRR